jgi:hypothetical protein
MKFCKDCKHWVGSGEGGNYAKCGINSKVSLVTGLLLLNYCDTERNFGKCGQEAKNFEPKYCENCGERPPMEHTPYCEVCRDEMEDRYAENEKAIAQHE